VTATTAARPAPVYDLIPMPRGYALRRDGAAMSTPGGNPFALPTEALARAVEQEWKAVKIPLPSREGLGEEELGKKYSSELKSRSGGTPPHLTSPARGQGFLDMPLTQLAATAIDLTGRNRSEAVDRIAAYGESELLCHRAEEPPELIARQQKMWQPVLDWCAERHGAPLKVTAGVMPAAQPDESLRALRAALETLDAWKLTGLQQAVHAAGSLVLGLALIEGHLDAAQVFAAAELDASFQIEKWGEDPAAASRREGIRRELALCERWFGLLG